MASSASGTRILQDLSPDDGSSSEDPLEDARSVAASHFSTARATLTSSVTMPSLLTLKSGKSSTRHTILESSKESLLVEEAKGFLSKVLFKFEIKLNMPFHQKIFLSIDD